MMSEAASQQEPDEVDAGLFKRSGGGVGGKKRDIPSSAAPGAGGIEVEMLLEYDMNHPRRGLCIIFNQVKFAAATQQSERVGSDVDADSLERSFRSLGFDVRPFRDLVCKKIISVIDEIRREDHSKSDCLAVVILSHGENGTVYGADGKIRLDKLARLLRPDSCPTLAGKPKLFFIQACRGSEYDKGCFEKADGDGKDDTDAGKLSRIPLESDFLYFYSTPPGYYSWRNDVRGSWFVQELCRVLQEFGDSVELSHLLLIVQRYVAAGYQSSTNDEKTSGMKQIPVSVSTLRKLLYFKRK